MRRIAAVKIVEIPRREDKLGHLVFFDLGLTKTENVRVNIFKEILNSVVFKFCSEAINVPGKNL